VSIVNRLVPILLYQPGLLTAQHDFSDRIPFLWLAELLGDKLLNGEEAYALRENDETMATLDGAFLPMFARESWYRPSDEWQVGEPLGDSEWFSLFITDETGQRGVTIPQNNDETDLVAAWSGDPEYAGLVTFDPRQSQLVHFSQAHCAPPSWNRCGAGKCGNPCELTTLSDIKWGEIKTCRCPHGR
jgi:hypothetical protein